MNTAKAKLIVIIPAYEPPREFIDYAREVCGIAEELVVVNDGSSKEYDGVFNEIAAIENVKLIAYGENHGKGYALKEAFKYCVDTYDESYVCVTADCDGQHAIEDICRISDATRERGDELILGSRNFDIANVPKKSKAGNTSIRNIFRILYGIKLTDTQTGLRGFTVKLAERFLSVHGNRFEYEMNMLIHAQKNSIAIVEVPIKTIYPDDPKDHVSHYKAFRDSTRIMVTVLKNLNWYVLSSLLSGLLDVVAFSLLANVFLQGKSALNTLIATAGARVISSMLNFALNRKYVFAGKSKSSIYKYYILWLCQLCASYGLVYLFGHVLHLPMTPMKLVGDLALSFVSYQIQMLWVFKNKKSK